MNKKYYFPFGETVKRLVQQDRTPKKVFVLGVYASAVHARWSGDALPRTTVLAVASEPRIFWDGNPEEAAEIISRIKLPEGAGTLKPAGKNLNGPSAKVLDEHILLPLGYTRKDAWLCDLLPESRLNPNQVKALKETYLKVKEKFGLNDVTVPECHPDYCDNKRCKEILEELEESKADILILLGDVPIKQFLNVVASVDFNSLKEFDKRHGYGKRIKVTINGRTIEVQPLAHPRQIGGLGHHSKEWFDKHQEWERLMK